mmetsp:Transcript_311/g.592  ORF Transcript_311/g.592 Transcript_311/m.592 type:complete len:226 (+) Transcript_311:338-1015(+)
MPSLNVLFSSVMVIKIMTGRAVWINHIHSSFLPTREKKLEEKGMMEGDKNSTKKSSGRIDMVKILTASATVVTVAAVTVIAKEGGRGKEPAESIKGIVAGGRRREDARADVMMTIMHGGKRNGGPRHRSRYQGLDLDRFHRRCRGPRHHRRRRIGGETIAVAVRRENERSTAAATTVDLVVVPNTSPKMRRRARSTTMLTMLGTKRRTMRMSSSIKCKLQNQNVE